MVPLYKESVKVSSLVLNKYSNHQPLRGLNHWLRSSTNQMYTQTAIPGGGAAWRKQFLVVAIALRKTFTPGGSAFSLDPIIGGVSYSNITTETAEQVKLTDKICKSNTRKCINFKTC